MTQEEKQILYQDLCARLPYGVKCREAGLDSQICTLRPEYLKDFDNIDRYEPYLRNMNSITDEELAELKEATCPNGTGTFNKEALLCPMSHWGEVIPYKFMVSIISWLDAHFFDHRGLIPLGLAIWVTEKNNPYKSEK